jgi:hypothetical protein
MKVKNRDDMIPVNVPEVKQQEIVDGFLLGKGLDIETWMLKLLPIKSNVFQTIQRDIAAVSILRGKFTIDIISYHCDLYRFLTPLFLLPLVIVAVYPNCM